jgi:hypothetical protein
MRHNPLSRRVRRVSQVIGLALTVAFASASPALADDEVTVQTTSASIQECQDPTFVQPFTGLKDNRHYVLAPGGDFSDPSGAGWQFDGGAQIVDDMRPDGTAGGVLAMPSGSVATSPVMCVDMNYPTARMWVRKLTGDGDVKVSVAYVGSKTASAPKEVGKVHGHGKAWGLSDDVKIKPELAGKYDGWRKVAFVFVAGGNDGDFRIDDFYVDPRMSR